MLISSVISAKVRENPPSLNKLFCSRIEIYQQGSLYHCVLLGVSLSFLEQVLGGTFSHTYGEASGFFCVCTTGLPLHDICFTICKTTINQEV